MIKIVVLLVIVNLTACFRHEVPKRYVLNVECGGLTDEQCTAKAGVKFKEYCQTNDDKVCKSYKIYDYEKAAKLAIDLSTISECIDNDGSITKCICKEEIVNSATKVKGIICRDILNANTELTPSYTPSTAKITEVSTDDGKTSTASSTVPAYRTVTNSHTTSEQNTISLSETTEADTSSHTQSTGAITGENTVEELTEVSTDDGKTSTASSTVPAFTTVTNSYSTSEQNTITLGQTTEAENLLEQGWIKTSKGIFYKVFTDNKVTYAEAKSNCEEQKAALASNVFREAFCEILTGYSVWIGLNDIEKEGTFVWEDGVMASSSTPWNVGEPNNAGGDENCVFLVYGLNDVPCNVEFYYICEKNI